MHVHVCKCTFIKQALAIGQLWELISVGFGICIGVWEMVVLLIGLADSSDLGAADAGGAK